MESVDRRLLVSALILFVNALGTGLILPRLPFFATLVPDEAAQEAMQRAYAEARRQPVAV